MKEAARKTEYIPALNLPMNTTVHSQRILQPDEVVKGRPFTSPTRYERDQSVLGYMLEDLRATLGEMAEGEITVSLFEPIEWIVMGLQRRLILCDPMRIVKRSKVCVVGFFGERNRDRDWTPLEEANADIVLEFRSYPGILSYTSIELADGNWANLVIHDLPDDRERWRSSERHAQVASALSPLYYKNVRIHNGYIDGGVLSGKGIVLERTKYWDYRAKNVWQAVRELRESNSTPIH